MRMIDTEKNLYIQETEIKPNRYAATVLLVTLLWILACWALNEVGIFRVGDMEMRVGTGITAVAILFPLVLMKVKKVSLSDPRLKYLLIICGGIFTLSVTTLMTFHTTLMLIFPIFTAMLYKSKTLGRIALAISLICTVSSIILSYVLGTWDVPLLKELTMIGTNGTVTVTGAEEGISMVNILKLLLYMVLPRFLMVGSCAILMFYVIKIGTENVNRQIEIRRLSYLDPLTELYNRNYYREMVETEDQRGPVGVMFFDVNNLKEANDLHGHEYGDLLLKRCARSILNTCDEGCTAFRLGGDEFLLIADGADENRMSAMLDMWHSSLNAINRENMKHYSEMNCSMAVGYAAGDYSDISELVKRADEVMYENKGIAR